MCVATTGLDSFFFFKKKTLTEKANPVMWLSVCHPVRDFFSPCRLFSLPFVSVRIALPLFSLAVCTRLGLPPLGWSSAD